jgi:epoxyqueuosine reductase
VPDKLQLNDEIQRLAREVGFDLAGVATAADAPEHRYFPDWVSAGRAGEMRYLEARNESGELKRASLSNAAPWARSVVVCAMNYNVDQPYSTHAGTTSQGWISRYAWSQCDYHVVLLAKLRQLETAFISSCEKNGIGTPRTWCYVDTGPVIERIFAKQAGIGWIGKNTCVLNEKLGSWLFLGVMLTSVPLTPGLPAADRCGSCTRCLDACPTRAFPSPYQLDATRCISYLTIEKRGPIPEDLRVGMGRQVFGCDICQDVCPWNRQAPITTEPGFAARLELMNPELERLAELGLDEFRQLFRGTPVKRAKHAGLLRNVAIAMGNSGETKFLSVLPKLEEHEDPAVSGAAQWAIRQLQNRAQSEADQQDGADQ